MGLFDYVNCQYPLPGDPPKFIGTPGNEFQTKDFDNPYLRTFTITADGRLLDSAGEEMPYHGDVEFYTSNQCGSDGQGGIYTHGGADVEWVEYRARFTEGRLSSLTETFRERQPAKPMSEFPRW